MTGMTTNSAEKQQNVEKETAFMAVSLFYGNSSGRESTVRLKRWLLEGPA